MHWRQTGVALAVVAAAGVVVAPAASAATGWQATVLPLPDGARGGWVTGTDGQGNYSGTYYDAGGTGATMAIWSGDEVVSVAPPAGCLEVSAVGETTTGVIAVEARYCGDAQDTSLPYFYSDGGYRALALPAGYTGARTEAVDSRGDVLGRASGPGEATVVWPVDSSQPVVIPDTLPGQQPADLYDDGETVLFQTDDGPYLWHDGTMSALAVPGGWDEARGAAVCGGTVVGTASRSSWTETHAIAWPTPTQPVALQAGDGRYANACNTSGLVAGGLMTWRGAGSAGSLPLPPGYNEGGAFAVGEDDSVVGVVTIYDDGGRQYDDPVVWRWR